MTQALYTSMTGLNAGTEQLTVVSDNVANMNTTAYKTSRVDFQDIWYQTKTTGTNSTAVSGGTNPYQVGVGVQCSSITKNFSASSTITTGNSTDMAITGQGWFSVINPDGQMLLTRDGTFALDENGYLCTASGNKVLGMNDTTSSTGCTIPIKFPTAIKVIEEPTNKTDLKSMKISELNNCETITAGDFKVFVNEVDGTGATVGTTELTIKLDPTKINNKTDVQTLAKEINDQADGFTVEVVNGSIQFKMDDNIGSLQFESIPGGSNFIKQTNIAAQSPVTITNDDGSTSKGYLTNPLNYSATITEVDDITADTTQLYKSFSVGQDGLITVTYGDGSVLTVASDPDTESYFSYTDANGVIINDDNTNSLYVDPNVLVKANMQLQLIKVTNDNGLVAEGNNTYSIGVDCGKVIYTAAGINGTGNVVAGALESSNVDLAEQFSNMILAQRLVQANSQVFNGANSLLETLVYLGR